MTDRRPVNTASKSWSSSPITTIEDGSCGGSSWCDDKSTTRHKNVGANISNEKPMGVTRMKRFHLVLYLIAAFSFYHLIRKGPSMLDPEEGAQVVKKNKTESINTDINSNAFTVPGSELRKSSSNFVENDSDPKSLPIAEETHNPTNEPTKPNVDKPSLTSPGVISSDKSSDWKQKSVKKSDKRNDWDNSSNDKTFVKSEKWKRNQTNTFAGPKTPVEENAQPKEKINEAHNNTDSRVYKKNRTVDNSSWGSKNETQSINIPSSSPTQESDDPHEEPTKNSTATKTVSTAAVSEQFKKPISDSDLSPVALNFAETHCDLTNLKDGAWYPSGPEDDWQQRAPYVIVAGVWNAGVNPLANALLKHPQIDAAKQNDFFLPRNFDGRFSIKTSDKNINTNNETTAALTETNFNVKVFPARERMYASHYSKLTLRENAASHDEESTPTAVVASENDEIKDSKIRHVAMDVSPGLVFFSHETSHWILCTAPWVKVVVLLRNPIDRLYRQWSYSVNRLSLKLSLEDWVAPEMKLMQSLGMIDGSNEPSNDEDHPKMVVSEREAWQKYKASLTGNIVGAIGRSLYVLQLEELIQTYISAGKTPSEEIIILTTENIENNAEREYAELIGFLGLTPYEDTPKNIGNTTTDSASSALAKGLAEGTGTEPMSDETRSMLLEIFEPYNRRLTELLTSNGFEGDWDKLWEY